MTLDDTMATLLFQPSEYFEDHDTQMFQMAEIILIAQVMGNIEQVIGLLVFYHSSNFPTFGILVITIVLISLLLGAIMLWFLASGANHTLIWYLDNSDIEFRITAKVTAMGFTPQILSGLAIAPTAYFVSRNLGAITGPEFLEQLIIHPLIISAKLVLLLTFFWTGYIWMQGLRSSYDVSLRVAVLAIVPSILLLMMWNLLGIIVKII